MNRNRLYREPVYIAKHRPSLTIILSFNQNRDVCTVMFQEFRYLTPIPYQNQLYLKTDLKIF